MYNLIQENAILGGIEMRIALISCTSKKKQYKCTASELYSESPRFKLEYQYAKKRNCDEVYILSAKHGLISEFEIVEPYNETLNDKSTEKRKVWSLNVLNQMKNKFDLDENEFIILAGINYNKYLIPHLKKYELPLKGKSLGNWIPELRRLIENVDKIESTESIEDIDDKVVFDDFENTDDKCLALHKIFNKTKRYDWNQIDNIPFENGIYIMFQKGEKYRGMDRIVRVGTHRVDNRLKRRLRDHFVKKNADGSILRKNIGRALLHQSNDPYEFIWELDTSRREIKEQNRELIKIDYEQKIEEDISEYLRENISFICFQVDTQEERLRLEEAIISTLWKGLEFKCSAQWLGLNSPKIEIVNSGLWNVQGLNAEVLKESEINKIKNLIKYTYIKDKKQQELKIDVIKHKYDCNDAKNSIGNTKVSTAEIRNFIKNILDQAREAKLKYIDIVSGEIHKKMGLKNKMPSVCDAMYKLRKENDEILKTTPSGRSSTIVIRYYI